jgi:16S rRNA (guanine527-N7)-methyltransferase
VLDLQDLIQKGADALNLEINTALLSDYLLLLAKWNKAYNLTAVRDLDAMVLRHIFDSLSIAKFLKGENILDLGSGAGLPGIPLAIAYPRRNFVLLDSNSKKTRFLQEAKRQLKLSNVEVVWSRADAYSAPVLFDTITARAVADIEPMLVWTRHLLQDHGLWLFMKSQHLQKIILDSSYPYLIEYYTLPYTDLRYSCVIVEKRV